MLCQYLYPEFNPCFQFTLMSPFRLLRQGHKISIEIPWKCEWMWNGWINTHSPNYRTTHKRHQVQPKHYHSTFVCDLGHRSFKYFQLKETGFENTWRCFVSSSSALRPGYLISFGRFSGMCGQSHAGAFDLITCDNHKALKNTTNSVIC